MIYDNFSLWAIQRDNRPITNIFWFPGTPLEHAQGLIRVLERKC